MSKITAKEACRNIIRKIRAEEKRASFRVNMYTVHVKRNKERPYTLPMFGASDDIVLRALTEASKEFPFLCRSNVYYCGYFDMVDGTLHGAPHRLIISKLSGSASAESAKKSPSVRKHIGVRARPKTSVKK